MAITTYSELQTSIGTWTGDTFTDAQKEEFIALAEAKFNRTLRTLDMETRATATVSGEYVALPDDYLELRAIKVGDYEMSYATPSQVRAMWADGEAGSPRFYTIEDGQFKFAPIPGSSPTVEIIYYAKVPALTDSNTSNWVLASHPDLYLSQCLALAETFGWNDPRAAGFAATAEGIIASINSQENKRRMGSSPLKVRTGIPYEGVGMGRQSVVARS